MKTRYLTAFIFLLTIGISQAAVNQDQFCYLIGYTPSSVNLYFVQNTSTQIFSLVNNGSFYPYSNPYGFINSTFNTTYDALASGATYNATYHAYITANVSGTSNNTLFFNGYTTGFFQNGTDGGVTSTYNTTYHTYITTNVSSTSNNTLWFNGLGTGFFMNKTFNSTYDANVDTANTTAQMRNAINQTLYYNLTAQMCYYLNNNSQFYNKTSNIDLGAFNLTTIGFGQFKWVDKLENTTPMSQPPANTLRLYVQDYKGFSIYKFIDDTGMSRELVRDSIIIVRNVRGTTISAFRFVYANGSLDNVPTVDLARADSINTMPAIGVTIEDIANGAYGRVMQVGLVEGVNSNSFSEGDPLYVSDIDAGLAKNTKPITPNLTQEMGTVLVKDATIGKVQIVARSLSGNDFGTVNNFTVLAGKYFLGDGSQLANIKTYNVSYNANVSSTSNNTLFFNGYTTGFFQNGTETDTANTTTQMRNAINQTLYYNLTAQMCYYLNNATQDTAYQKTYNSSYLTSVFNSSYEYWGNVSLTNTYNSSYHTYMTSNVSSICNQSLYFNGMSTWYTFNSSYYPYTNPYSFINNTYNSSYYLYSNPYSFINSTYNATYHTYNYLGNTSLVTQADTDWINSTKGMNATVGYFALICLNQTCLSNITKNATGVYIFG